jgi:hypothetical protein
MSLPKSLIEAFCQGIIRRVGARNVGIDPITITTIISTVLPLILNCIQKRRGIQPDQVQTTVVAMCARNYVQTRENFAKELRNRWFKHGQKLKRAAKKSGAMFNESKYILSDADSLELADKALQEAHSTSAESYRNLAAASLSTEE